MREAAEAWPFLNRQVYGEGDPALSIIQWALEPWDAQVYNIAQVNHATQRREQFVLQFQGHDWRAFDPLSSVIDLGGFQRLGSFGVVRLPQSGKSVVVQVDNAGYPPGTTPVNASRRMNMASSQPGGASRQTRRTSRQVVKASRGTV